MSCQYIFKKGKNKGLACSKKSKGSFCYIHKEKIVHDINCSICLKRMTSKNICILKCDHKFHLNCILQMNHTFTPYSNKCPICREKFHKYQNNNTMQKIHDMSLHLPGHRADLIHIATHLPEEEISEIWNHYQETEEERN